MESSVQEQVKEKYGSAARAVAESGSVQACCDPGVRAGAKIDHIAPR